MAPASSSPHDPPERPPISAPARRIPAALLLVVTLLAGAAPAAERAQVLKVIDGDSVMLRLDGARVECRLLGIDAPEWGQTPWGPRAARHLRRLLEESAMRVGVETDRKKRDRFGRLLVYLRDREGRLLNLRMVRDGYAVVLVIPPNLRHADRLRAAQREARRARRGFWAEGGLKESPTKWRRKHPRTEKGH